MYAGNNSNKKLEKQVRPINVLKQETSKEIPTMIMKRENMVIYLLINEAEKAYSRLKEVISPENFQNEVNQQILKKLYEELEKGNSNNSQILDKFEEETIISHLTEIMAYDFEITDVDKAVEDLINIYEKEKLVQRRNVILKQLENSCEENIRQLEKELNEVILKLAKMK